MACSLIFTIALAPLNLHAEELDPHRYEPAILPVLSGNTDIGFLFGAMGIMAKFDPAFEPYRWKAWTVIAMSVKNDDDKWQFPQRMLVFESDFPGLSDGRLRLRPMLAFNRISNLGYFGLGNASKVNNDDLPGQPAHRRNQFIRSSQMVGLNAQINLVKNTNFLTGAYFEYSAVSLYEQSKLSEDKTDLLGLEGFATVSLSLGLNLDTRDHELVPNKGMFHHISFRMAPSRLLWGGVTASGRFYFSIIPEYLTLATRAVADVVFGQVPFFELSNMGAFDRITFAGLRGIRGIPEGRYHGRIKLLASAELRSMFWRFKLFRTRFRLGAGAIADCGRIWSDFKSNSSLDGTRLGLKYGLGGGPRIQWGETMIIRFDFVYSPDAADYDPHMPLGIYMDMRHAF